MRREVSNNLLVVEGIDGSGKGTQASLLRGLFEHKGVRTLVIPFPQYSSTFYGKIIGQYLNGDYGGLNSLPPIYAAMAYAGDRLEYKPMLEAALKSYDLVILDRYVASNIAHQGGKFTDEKDQQIIRGQIETMEYSVNDLPKPAMNILLDIDPALAMERVLKKSQRDYTSAKADIHEANFEYLTRVANIYRKLFTLTCREHMHVVIDSECTPSQIAASIMTDLRTKPFWNGLRV
jgi:dTMP kinase